MPSLSHPPPHFDHHPHARLRVLCSTLPLCETRLRALIPSRPLWLPPGLPPRSPRPNPISRPLTRPSIKTEKQDILFISPKNISCTHNARYPYYAFQLPILAPTTNPRRPRALYTRAQTNIFFVLQTATRRAKAAPDCRGRKWSCRRLGYLRPAAHLPRLQRGSAATAEANKLEQPEPDAVGGTATKVQSPACRAVIIDREAGAGATGFNKDGEAGRRSHPHKPSQSFSSSSPGAAPPCL